MEINMQSESNIMNEDSGPQPQLGTDSAGVGVQPHSQHQVNQAMLLLQQPLQPRLKRSPYLAAMCCDDDEDDDRHGNGAGDASIHNSISSSSSSRPRSLAHSKTSTSRHTNRTTRHYNDFFELKRPKSSSTTGAAAAALPVVAGGSPSGHNRYRRCSSSDTSSSSTLNSNTKVRPHRGPSSTKRLSSSCTTNNSGLLLQKMILQRRGSSSSSSFSYTTKNNNSSQHHSLVHHPQQHQQVNKSVFQNTLGASYRPVPNNRGIGIGGTSLHTCTSVHSMPSQRASSKARHLNNASTTPSSLQYYYPNQFTTQTSFNSRGSPRDSLRDTTLRDSLATQPGFMDSSTTSYKGHGKNDQFRIGEHSGGSSNGDNDNCEADDDSSTSSSSDDETSVNGRMSGTFFAQQGQDQDIPVLNQARRVRPQEEVDTPKHCNEGVQELTPQQMKGGTSSSSSMPQQDSSFKQQRYQSLPVMHHNNNNNNNNAQGSSSHFFPSVLDPLDGHEYDLNRESRNEIWKDLTFGTTSEEDVAMEDYVHQDSSIPCVSDGASCSEGSIGKQALDTWLEDGPTLLALSSPIVSSSLLPKSSSKPRLLSKRSMTVGAGLAYGRIPDSHVRSRLNK